MFFAIRGKSQTLSPHSLVICPVVVLSRELVVLLPVRPDDDGLDAEGEEAHPADEVPEHLQEERLDDEPPVEDVRDQQRRAYDGPGQQAPVTKVLHVHARVVLKNTKKNIIFLYLHRLLCETSIFRACVFFVSPAPCTC